MDAAFTSSSETAATPFQVPMSPVKPERSPVIWFASGVEYVAPVYMDGIQTAPVPVTAAERMYCLLMLSEAVVLA